jgi:hypothetical protein
MNMDEAERHWEEAGAAKTLQERCDGLESVCRHYREKNKALTAQLTAANREIERLREIETAAKSLVIASRKPDLISESRAVNEVIRAALAASEPGEGEG